MAFIGNQTTIQQYAPTISYLSGNGSTTAFTLPIAVASAAQIIVTVENVIQNPAFAFSVSGTTLTFTSAPPSGTNNIWVEYTALQTNTIAPSQGTVQDSSFGSITKIPFVSGASIGAGNASIMKNRIINGAMVIAQRGTGSTSVQTTSSYVTCDRWAVAVSQNSKFTIQQSTTAPAGFSNSLLITSSSAYSIASGDYFGFYQVIEGFNWADLSFGTANAKTVTLSFQVQSSLTGTFGGALTNGAGTRSYPFTYTISSANTWTPISITIAGDTGGTWIGATNAGAAIVQMNLGTGSTYSGTAGSWASANYSSATGATSVVGTNGATFYITGVQLEVGSSATGFEYRQYGQELALCQRYYEVLGNGGVGSSTTNPAAQAIAFKYQVTKRATPTITHLANYTLLWAGSATFTATGTGSNGSSLTGFNASVTVSSAPGGTGAALVYITATDNISASAEL